VESAQKRVELVGKEKKKKESLERNLRQRKRPSRQMASRCPRKSERRITYTHQKTASLIIGKNDLPKGRRNRRASRREGRNFL